MVAAAGTATASPGTAASGATGRAATGPAAAGWVAQSSAAPAWSATAMPLGPVVQNLHNLGRDNGQSARLGSRSYWTFGDTLETTDGPGAAFIDNSGAVTGDLDASDGIAVTSPDVFTESGTTAPVRLLPFRPQETAFAAKHAAGCTGATDAYCGTQFAMWPGVVVPDPARHRLLVPYLKLCRGGAVKCPSAYVGTGIGYGIAAIYPRSRSVVRLTARRLDVPVPTPEGRDPTLLFGIDEGGTGAGLAEHGWLYLLVHCQSPAFSCVVARAPLAQVMDRSRWRFYAGSHAGRPVWSRFVVDGVATTRMGAAGGSLQWVPGMHSYLSTWLEPLGNNAYFQTAPHVWGPWSAPALLFPTAPTSTTPNYALFAHPEYATDGGLTQYFTYYSPGTLTLQLEQVRFTAGPLPAPADVSGRTQVTRAQVTRAQPS